MSQSKDFRAPTAEQQAIIDLINVHGVVAASAGSGKTFVISRRYLNLVKNHGVRPSEILTITFTRKSAAEMKSRIVSELRNAELYEAAQEAETGPIQTIDSFNFRILRENSIRAELDPEFEVMSEQEAKVLLRDTIRHVLMLEPDDDPILLDFVKRHLGVNQRDDPGAYNHLIDLVKNVVNWFRGCGQNLREIEDRYRDPIQFLSETDRWMYSTLPAELSNELSHESEWKEAISKLKFQRSPELAWTKTKFDSKNEMDCARETVALAQLACRSWLRFDGELKRRKMLDNAGAALKVARLLEEDSIVRRRVSQQYRYVMIDESQDNNPLQYRLIDQIQSLSTLFIGDEKQSIYGFRNADVESFRSRSGLNRFTIAQSFRFSETLKLAIDEVFSLLLKDDYPRMTPALGWDENLTPEKVDGVDVIRELGPSQYEATVQYVKSLQSQGVPLRNIGLLVMKKRYGTELANALRAAGIEMNLQAQENELFARLEIRDVANVLIASCDETDAFAHLAVLRSPFVNLSLDAILWISNEVLAESDPNRPRAIRGIRRPIREVLKDFSCSDPEDQEKLDHFLEWFLPITSTADRLAAWEVLSEVLAVSPFFTHLAPRRNGRIRIENVRKLLSIATRYPDLGPGQYAKLIRQWNEIKHSESEADLTDPEDDAVTIITVHSAKGLEWEYVVLVDAQLMKTQSIYSPIFEIQTGYLACKIGNRTSMFFEFMKSREKSRRDDELIRQMYVSATRAKKRLALVEHGKKSSGLPLQFRNALSAKVFDLLPKIQVQSKFTAPSDFED